MNESSPQTLKASHLPRVRQSCIANNQLPTVITCMIALMLSHNAHVGRLWCLTVFEVMTRKQDRIFILRLRITHTLMPFCNYCRNTIWLF